MSLAVIEPFKLAESNQQSIKKLKRPYAYNSEDEEDIVSYDDDDDFEIDSTALKGILNNTGIKDEDLRITGQATIAAIPSRCLHVTTTTVFRVVFKCYSIEPFKLAESNQQSIKKLKRPYAYNSEDEEDIVSYDDDDDFEIDSTALKGILNNTGIKDEDLRITGQATIAAIPSSNSELAITQPSEGILKRTSIYYTRPPPQNAAGASSSVSKHCPTPSTSQTTVCPLKPRNVDIAPAASSQVASCARKQVAWADEVPENDTVDFEPDSQALQSILSNTGISFKQMSVQNTGRVTLAGGRLTPYRK
ncbi:uncharacterized protein LOC110052986, partial [Orbicella faveolata]|uniref:uncharacterized protein LOC110052986 n=1 Tax=Orbicella faveolata TaxID=48498 RepID=UPI0009E5E09E